MKIDKTIYIIATDTFAGYEEDSTGEIVIQEILARLGYWTDETAAKLKCAAMNAAAMGDNDNPENWEDIYYVISLKENN